ncbi:hypothetical protein EYZ11_013165 [Aspergillus tanneri]|uniref:Uncharacterized protein n=1 Tax=Aspergillus tanneri TaxID=1220188 RepID=A0A4S3IYD2_9EURO|nr:hypothetical protein EYZ11_013165 [Aspergillus tanneri]
MSREGDSTLSGSAKVEEDGNPSHSSEIKGGAANYLRKHLY